MNTLNTPEWIIVGFVAFIAIIVVRLFTLNKAPKLDCPKCGSCMKGKAIEHKDGGRVSTVVKDKFGKIEETLTLIIGRTHYNFFCKKCSKLFMPSNGAPVDVTPA